MMNATEIFRDILSAAKALAVHHDITNELGDDFDRWLGLGLAERYMESEHSEADYQMMGQALRFHCGFSATASFASAMLDHDVEMPFFLNADGRFVDDENDPGRLLLPTMDIFALASQLRESGEMRPEWGPFRGPAGDLWQAGMTGADPEESPIVFANMELGRLLMGDDATLERPGAASPTARHGGFRGALKRFFG